MLEFIIRSKFVEDIIINGDIVLRDFMDYMYETKDFEEFDDITDYEEFIIDNLVDFKYDIITYMENNYHMDDLMKDNEIIKSLELNPLKIMDTIIDISLKYSKVV